MRTSAADFRADAYIKRVKKAEREFDALMGFQAPGTFGTPWKRNWKGGGQYAEVKTRLLTPDERQQMGI